MDSVEASIAPNFEYLWVNGYCIDQSASIAINITTPCPHTIKLKVGYERQILFKCNGSHFSEPLKIASEAMIDKSTGVFRSGVPTGAFEWKTPGSEPALFMRYVSEFTKRELTFLNNRLNAMASIFHAFERSMIPCLLIELAWQSNQLETRIIGCPSWSWTAWTGENATVQIEIGKEGPLQLPRWENSPDFSKVDLSNNIVLHIETETFTCSAMYYDEQNPIPSKYYSGKPGHYPTIPLEDGDGSF
ncbi:hypothetical protein BDZ45DRAFT_751620 [Acephala macrosclerotiorum]|nr:hypothetical protein BDZ45DRAFT_751620 [Acephala macrosclerotiorum]